MKKIFASIGEAMIEMAVAEAGLYRRGFAGDTLNTAWGVRGLTDAADVEVRYVTRVGDDVPSDEMVRFIAGAGIDTAQIGRVAGRPVGLYMITLNGHERSFSYWRDTSAAKLLAADPATLRAGIADADCVYFSGITLAILTPEHRRTLLEVLDEVRCRGAMVVFDANVRPRLWPDADALRAGIEAGYRVATVAMPTFEDEDDLFGDGSPDGTVRRIAGYGVGEIVVKNGGEPCTLSMAGHVETIPAVPDVNLVDTTGAGDSFNAGYISARLAGRAPSDAVRLAHRVAAKVIGRRGALIETTELRSLAVTPVT
jgi:2-dehydro-3-deoxygluconokinase